MQWPELLTSVCCTKQLSRDAGAVKGGNWFTRIFIPAFHLQGVLILWIDYTESAFLYHLINIACNLKFSIEVWVCKGQCQQQRLLPFCAAKVISLPSTSQVSKLLGWGCVWQFLAETSCICVQSCMLKTHYKVGSSQLWVIGKVTRKKRASAEKPLRRQWDNTVLSWCYKAEIQPACKALKCLIFFMRPGCSAAC